MRRPVVGKVFVAGLVANSTFASSWPHPVVLVELTGQGAPNSARSVRTVLGSKLYASRTAQGEAYSNAAARPKVPLPVTR
jgi:hypothetical protein